MKILITGSNGMLGRTFVHELQHHEVIAATREHFDIRNAEQTSSFIRSCSPDVVLHCAAMTQVDACEEEQDLAFAVNAIGSGNVAIASHHAGARLIAISTDYVFDGSAERPYHEWDTTQPKTVYGQSKWAGEEAIRAHCPNHLICRTAWLYGGQGPSFLHTMLRLGKQEGPTLKIVNDQQGNPTSCHALSSYIQQHLLTTPHVGTAHLTCEGEATWFTFAQAIFDNQQLSRELVPCTTKEFPRPAPRPANSRLEKRFLRLQQLPPMPHWNDAMNTFLASSSQADQ